MIRKAQFAGSWYPGDSQELRALLKTFMVDPVHDQSALAVIAPHAGYRYSGAVAGAVYSRVRIPDTVVVLCVNHRGLGAPAAIISSGYWETPLGGVKIQEEFAAALKAHIPLLAEDALAHAQEHSLEMQVPFIQYCHQNAQLVPICLQQLSLSDCEILGKGLAIAIKDYSGEVLLVASTDMTHFEPHEKAGKKDRQAISKILEVDPDGLYETIKKQRISMCGVVPTTAVLFACRELGALEGQLVKYATSGDISGDYMSVVGYTGIFI